MNDFSLVQIGESRLKQLSLATCFALLVFLPMVIHQQAITGPLVNAILLLSLLLFGQSVAFFFALLPSAMALAAGLLPLPLAPMLPFIMISNCLYIAIFARLRKQAAAGQLQAVFFAAVGKAVFLFAILTYVIAPLLPATMTEQMFFMMSVAQLWTAILGGVMAIGIYQLMGKYVDWSSTTRSN